MKIKVFEGEVYGVCLYEGETYGIPGRSLINVCNGEVYGNCLTPTSLLYL